MIRRDHELVEVAAIIDGDKARDGVRLLGDNDLGLRHQFVAPALAPPIHTLREIDRGIGELPGALPQRDRGVLVRGLIGAKVKATAHACAVVAAFAPGVRVALIVPSASARCGGCAYRRPRWWRCRAAGTRQIRPRPAAAPARR